MPDIYGSWKGAAATVVASAARTTSSNSSTLTGYGPAATLRAQLNISAAAGTVPTLDVLVEDTLDGTTFNTIGTFTQATGVTRQVIDITSPFSDQVRIKWTVGGTAPSFTFSVILVDQP